MRSEHLMPFVSVIVPCRNESPFIAGCLDSILMNGYSLDRLEVLVIDGMSEDGTREILARYATEYPCVKILQNPAKLTPTALNLGLSHARGSYVLRADAHAGLTPGYIRACIEALVQYEADAVGGIMKAMPARPTAMGNAIAAALSHPFGVGNSYFRIHAAQPKWVDTLFCGCYRRDAFERVQITVGDGEGGTSKIAAPRGCDGPFNVDLVRGQDMDFHLRLKRTGGRILLMPSITSFYFTRSDLKRFWQQSWNNGLWAILPFAYSDKIPIALRHMVPLAFVAVVLSTLAAAPILPSSLWVCGGILTGYGVANIVASFHAAWRERSFKMIVLMPLVFGALHVGYGLGSLWGMVTLAIRRMLKKRMSRATHVSMVEP